MSCGVRVLRRKRTRSLSREGFAVARLQRPSRRCRGHGAGVGVLLLLLAVVSCVPAISPQLRNEASVDVPFRDVLQDPERYTGKTFIWSGTVLDTQNTPDGTMLKVLQKPSDYWGRPKDVDRSEGRFLALDKRYLDPAIYAEGRAVTVAGALMGKQVQRLGDIDYAYPVLAVKEIHLWPKEGPAPYYYYPYDPYPYWGWRYYWWP